MTDNDTFTFYFTIIATYKPALVTNTNMRATLMYAITYFFLSLVIQTIFNGVDDIRGTYNPVLDPIY